MNVDTYDSLGAMIVSLVPKYERHRWRPFMARFRWDRRDVQFMRSISERRCERRVATYVIPGEATRLPNKPSSRPSRSIRFGHRKEGRGLHEKRGDFCLIGAAYERGNFTVFYRALDLMGGLHYDLAIFEKIEQEMKAQFRYITLMAPFAEVIAMKGNSNEKLHRQLIQHYREGNHVS